ncbi:MAG TPA: diaminopimelate epimerase, partial [Methanomassiliicoccales archaeon]|nr:diaminopimelate epimerase [Methanomassiliicoccales archaeon]
MRFWKYHGLGNDFVVVENFQGDMSKDLDFVQGICDRRFGIGADGILYIEKDDAADARMVVLNSDGSEAEMCGNGIRCVAKHLFDFGLVRKSVMTINTLAGIKTIECTVKGDKVSSVVVEMGAPRLDCEEVPMKCHGRFIDMELDVDGRMVRGTAVSMGNPHFIIFQDIPEKQADILGPLLERHDAFPRRTNVEFVKSENGVLSVRVFERGAGWTMACGTGACATVVAAALLKRVPFGREVEVQLPGGSLWINVSDKLDSVRMRGPAILVFEGETV